MKLRIARKMDPMQRHRNDGREWWKVYSIVQLARAEVRLRKRWSRHHAAGPDGREVSEDWFAANRVRTQRSRQIAIRRTTSPPPMDTSQIAVVAADPAELAGIGVTVRQIR